ncbi:Menaquinol-cytochrome c reductase cytochrome b subunit [Planctomycetales bacterium 10988]|nr:Menaquinol-cytochrome c reductase cytochrome b subunit [Planctomycetales bacterium 10988]
MSKIAAWLDDRTGYRTWVSETLYLSIPGGARWRYVWGTTLLMAFCVQVITGIFLWSAYSPGVQNAWESVYYIQFEMQGGWFLRGLHHFTAQAMVILLALHMLQVIIHGAYKAPREVNFWTGLVLLQLVLAMGLTGYLLPWDQRGFRATGVATNLAGLVPFVGDSIQKLAVGGVAFGQHTLTRFFALHAGILPGLLILFIIVHVKLFRRHGYTTPPQTEEKKKVVGYWPDQFLRDIVASLGFLAVVAAIVIYFGGAHLEAPADPANPSSAARPEWYFLFLFQTLKYFHGNVEFGSSLVIPAAFFGAIVIPGMIMTFLALMPFWGKWKWGHRVNLLFLCILACVIFTLSGLALYEDANDPDYQIARQQADWEAERIHELVEANGIGFEGALARKYEDPLSQGPLLFEANCSSCHRVFGHDGLGNELAEEASAPDLGGFGSRPWIEKLLDPEHVAGPDYFGNTAFAEGDMVYFVQDSVGYYEEEQSEALEKGIIALSAEAELAYQSDRDDEARASGELDEGIAYLKDDTNECSACHAYRGVNEDGFYAPDLTGYGSRDWMIQMVSNPEHPQFYPDSNDRMPAFEEILSQREIGLIVDWIRLLPPPEYEK